MYVLTRDENIQHISLNHVKNTIAKYKQEKYGKTNITLEDLQNFIENQLNVPEHDDKSFVINFERSPDTDDYDGEEWFRYFVTTKRLLQLTIGAKNIHADTTFKICIQGYPLSVVGTTDIVDFTVLDGSTALQNAVRDTFGDDPTIIMCWFYVMMNFNKRKLNNNANRDAMREDIRKLKLSYSEDVSNVGRRLFLEKWKETEKEFTEYFEAMYFKRNSNWFNGAGNRTPSTNNSIERFNGTLKQQQTFYERKGLSEFMVNLMEIVSDRSRAYVFGKNPFQSEIIFPEDVMSKGFELAKTKKKYVLVVVG